MYAIENELIINAYINEKDVVTRARLGRIHEYDRMPPPRERDGLLEF